MVQTLNKTAIYHINPYSTQDGAKHVLQMNQYSFKNLRSKHGNYENMLF